MPVLQNLYNNKQSWTENNVTKEQILTKTSYISDAGEIVWETIAEKIKPLLEKVDGKFSELREVAGSLKN